MSISPLPPTKRPARTRQKLKKNNQAILAAKRKRGRSSRKAKHNPQMENVLLGPMGDPLWFRPLRCSSIRSGTSSLCTKVKFSIVSVI